MRRIIGMLIVLLFSTTMVGISYAATGWARIASITNKVEANNGGGWFVARTFMTLPSGSLIRTGSASGAKIQYSNGTVVQIGSRTVMRIKNFGENSINLKSGRLWLNVKKRKGSTFKVYTPAATAAVAGTEWIADVSYDSNGMPVSTFSVISGQVNVFNNLNPNSFVNLTAGMRTTVNYNQTIPPSTSTFNPDELKKELEKEMIPIDNNNNSNIASSGDKNLSESPLKPTNITTNLPQNNSDVTKINPSPTTGDLEIIIK